MKEHSAWGWIFYRRVKTGKAFYRPMNRVVHTHIKSIMPESPCPNDPVFLAGGSRPNSRFQSLCRLAGLSPKRSPEDGVEKPCELKDLRKPCATHYDEHMLSRQLRFSGIRLAELPTGTMHIGPRWHTRQS